MLLGVLACGRTPAPAVPVAGLPPVAPVCAELPKASGTVRVTPVRGVGVEDAEVDRALGLLAGRLALQGLTVDAVGPSVPLGSRYALGRSPAEEGPELGPLVGFLATEREGVHVVVVDGILDPRSSLARHLVLMGFGIGPGAAVSPEAEIVRSGLEPRFPVVVVDRRGLQDADAGGRLLVHELGHARGLAHGAGVMDPGGSACTDGFREADLVRIADPGRP
ncbi:MAG: hypothetical protein H6734_08970 [Alphaproteobacteria bacterium]|nr:hypothetical protein [Alphaproteobacteria bacterium]